jgi:ribosomal protein S18 acetylase RimI-like enzyme
MEREELFVAEIGGKIIGTLTLQWSDPMFWGEQPPDAGYIHRLAVRRDHAGTGLGAALVDWAAVQVRARGRTSLRLDAPADNVRLGELYERLGFVYRGDAEGDRSDADGSLVHWITRRYERTV